MIKRSESESATKARTRSARDKRGQISRREKRRRLMVEGLEQRRLLAAGAGGNPTIPVVDVPTFTGPRNIGSVAAFSFVESEGITDFNQNDTIFDADVVPLGNLPGQENTIDITGTLPVTTQNTNPPSVHQRPGHVRG